MIANKGVAGVDLGKSQCRVAVVTDDTARHSEGIGAPGLAASGGVDAAFEAITTAMPTGVAPTHLGVGAAGALAAPRAAMTLAERLAEHFSCPVAVTSDAVTAHAGALEGGFGTLLVAGTGAVGLGLDDTALRVIDGWGPVLGDFGSGAWIGREGLRAVLRAESGLGDPTTLSAATNRLIPTGEPLSAWVAGADGARRCGSFAPDVIASSEAGDPVARRIVTDAAGLLTQTAVAAAGSEPRVALHGGLMNSTYFRSLLSQHLAQAGLVSHLASGNALDGAVAIALNDNLPHERVVHRATE